MPDRGLLEATSVEDVAFDTSAGLSFEDARWLQVTFEVNRAAALSFMPSDVGRPIPPYARLLVAASPAGNLALLSVGGRYRMMPRNVVVAVVADGAFERASGAFGSGASEGTVTVERTGAEVSASVSDGGRTLATVMLPDIYAIEPTMLRWDPFVALGRADRVASIAEVTPAHVPEAAFLSKGAVVEMERTLPREHAWRQLQSLNVVSACYVEGTLAFGAPAVQQTWS